MDPPGDVADTFLTERQAEVIALRESGLTQTAIADRIGTSVANVSAVESAGRENVSRARRTLTLARLLGAATRFRVEAGADLRDVVDRVFEVGDDEGIRVAYTDPELSTRLGTHLDDRLAERQLTGPAEIGITADGEVVTHPSAVIEGPFLDG